MYTSETIVCLLFTENFKELLLIYLEMNDVFILVFLFLLIQKTLFVRLTGQQPHA